MSCSPTPTGRRASTPADLVPFALIEASGGLDGLLTFGRRCADQHLGVLRRLDPEQRAHPVTCRFEDRGELRMEGEMPWGQIAIEIQAARHLTGHTAQLRNLR